MLFFPSTLQSGDPVKTSFTLGSYTLYTSAIYGGSGLSILMVSAIFNSTFLAGYPAFNEISIVKGGALRSVMISFATCF